jgi:hypothetical protein
VNFNASREFGRYLKNIRRPAAVLVGSADEQVVADQFAPLFQSLDVNIPVTIVPRMTQANRAPSGGECCFAAEVGPQTIRRQQAKSREVRIGST